METSADSVTIRSPTGRRASAPSARPNASCVELCAPYASSSASGMSGGTVGAGAATSGGNPRVSSASALPREGFEENLNQMRDEILAGMAVLALFQGGEADNQDAALFSEGLYLAHKSSGDVIYTAHP